MYTTYKGYFQDGCFVPDESVSIPDHVEVHVTVVGTATLSAQTEAQAQRAAFETFFSAIAGIEDEPITDAMIDDLRQNRVTLRKELD